MVQKSRLAQAEWTAADAAARAAEARLQAAWLAFEEKTGPAPGAEMLAEVSALRTVANDRLTHALEMMRRAQRHGGD